MNYVQAAAAAVLISGLVFGFYVTASLPYDGGDRQEPELDPVDERGSGGSSDEVTEVDVGDGSRDVYGGAYGDVTDGMTLSGEEADWTSVDSPWFEEVAGDVGFVYEEDRDRFREGEVVAGVYVTDFDGDGWMDVLALGDGPTLFENQEGEFVVSSALPDLEDEYFYALFFDHDNSGYEDLYLLSDEASVFLKNEGGEFVRDEVGLDVEFDGVRAAAAGDYTGDGCLDVFVVQAGSWRETRPAGFSTRDISHHEDNGEPNRLFRGDCGSFQETTVEAGIEGEAWSLATSFVDLTDDGFADVHVANDFNEDVLYLNQGDGSFERRILPEYTNRNGMSSEVADVSGNGLLDIFVTNIYFGESDGEVVQRFGGRTKGNNLLLNQGDGVFRDAADEYGVRRGGWGWASLLADFDNSGDLDLFHTVGTGIDDYQFLWRAGDDGFTRLNSSDAGFRRSSGFGVAALDFDGDGSLDVAVANRDGPFELYRNLNEGGYLRVTVEPTDDYTAVGSRVTVKGDGWNETRVLTSNSDYMSQSSKVVHLGLEGDSTVDVEVQRPSGEVDGFDDVKPNSTVVASGDGLQYLR